MRFSDPKCLSQTKVYTRCAGKGELTNRRHVQKLGPLVIYDQDQGVTKAFRNIPGVDVIQVKFSCIFVIF